MTGAFDILVGSTVQLKDSAGITSELTPTSITETSMTVTLPTTIAPGTYQITAKKGPSLGNPLSLAVTPSTSIASATCVRSTKTLTVTGTKFGEYLNATGSGTAVTMNGVKGTVISWTDTTITARFPSCPTRSTATVDTIFDAVSASVVRR